MDFKRSTYMCYRVRMAYSALVQDGQGRELVWRASTGLVTGALGGLVIGLYGVSGGDFVPAASQGAIFGMLIGMAIGCATLLAANFRR